MKDLKLTGRKTDNVYCGIILGSGKRVAGCGAKPNAKGFSEFSYRIDGYDALWSTVSLCPHCAAQVKPVNPMQGDTGLKVNSL